MVRVRLWARPPPARAGVEYNFPKDAHLRHVQKELCGLFRRPFPAMMASVRTENKTFDSFMDQPFLECADGENIEVVFSATDDPYFFDLEDRRVPKITLEEEMEWERLKASGETTMSLAGWIRAQRAVPTPTADDLPAFEFPALAVPLNFPPLKN